MSWPIRGITVLTDLQCNGGLPKADLPIADLGTFVLDEEITDLLVCRKLTVSVPTAWPDSVELIARRVLLVLYVDPTAGTSGLGWDEFRISELEPTAGLTGLTTITALGIEYDLGERDLPLFQTVNTVVSFTLDVASFEIVQALTDRVIANAPSYIGLGTVTPAGSLVTTLSGDNPLSTARKFAAAINKNVGLTYELSLRPNGTTNYLLDLTAYGATATVPDIRTNKSLQGVRRTTRTDQQTTRCVFIGSHGGTGRPHYRATAVVANTSIDVVDMAGGEGPVRETDQFKNMYIVDDGNVDHQITGSSRVDATTSRFLMASTAGIVAGEIVAMVLNTSHDEIPYIDSPSLLTAWGKKLGFLAVPNDQYTNFMLNGDMHLWTGASPGKPDALGECTWSFTGTGSTKILSLFKTGGVSALVPVSSTLNANLSGPYKVIGEVLTFTVILQLTTLTASNTFRFVNPNTGADENHLLDGTVVGLDKINTWLSYSASYTMTATGKLAAAGVAYAQLIVGAANPVYFDSFSVTKSPAAVQWRLGSAPATSIQAANLHLGTNGNPPVEYAINCLDLFRVDPNGVGQFERLSLGGNADVTETELSDVTTQRVMKIRTNHAVAHDTQLTLSNTPQQLTRVLAGG
jgi:hypothetical protein